jgi:hypothetical protein
MGVFDDSTRKLGRGQDPRHLKPERLAGQYEIYEGYDESPRNRARRRSAAFSRTVEAALEREALAMGALGLAIGLALGVTLAWRRPR